MILTAVPYCGLCNRLRCLASAFRIAEKTQRAFQFCWRVLPECGAAFNDLFEKKFAQVDEAYITSEPVNRLYSDSIVPDGSHVELLNNQIARHDRGRHVLIQSCGFVAFEDEPIDNWFPPPPIDFLTEMADWYRSLVPVKPVSDAVEKTAAAFNASTVGLHVRRTDHADAIARSTDAHFIAAIENAIQQDANANFFLATDCPRTQASFIARFPRRILIQEKTNWPNATDHRGTVQGMREALTDLLLLARTRRTLASARSTFGRDAMLFSDRPGEVEVIGDAG